MIFYLFIILSLIIFFNIIFYRGNLCCPAILFTAGFWLSTLWAWSFQEKWGGFNNILLLALISIGVISFCLGCFLVRMVFFSISPEIRSAKLQFIEVEKYKLILYLLFELLISVATIYVVLRNASSNNIFSAIGQYYTANKYNRLIYSPSYLKVLQYFNISGVLLAEYIVINNVLCKRRNTYTIYLIIFIGILISLLQGIRNTFFLLIISGVVMIFLLYGASTGWKSNIGLSTLPKIIFFVGIAIALFQVSTMITGRSSDEFSFVQLLSTYVGSPLKNLELYLSEEHRDSKVFAGQTLLQTYKKIYELTGDSKFNVSSLYSYRWVGDIGLGNVYTILMPLYQDFGLIGAGVVLFFIGVISESMYEHLQRCKSIEGINYGIIIYAYCAFSISFSFFSNKYFEMVVSMAFIYTMISMVLIKIFLVNIKVSGGRILYVKRRHIKRIKKKL